MTFTEQQFRDYEARRLAQFNRDGVESEGAEIESTLHDQIENECKRRGWYYVHSRLDRPTTTALGVPDFIIAMTSGVVWWIECKAKNRKPSIEQMAVGVMLKHLGQNYGLVRSMEEFLNLIDD